MFDKTLGKWLDASGPDADVVLSTRIRLARNIAGINFPGRTQPEDQERVVDRVEAILQQLSVFAPDRFLRSRRLTPLQTSYLVERHLASLEFASAGTSRALFVGPDETLSLMVNEEDHLRLQTLTSGLDFDAPLRELQGLDEVLGAGLGYAWSDQLGFLTACPTNLGTGLRASVLIHLPGLVLTREIEKILRGALQVGLAVRGLYGEGSETRGNLFQISNQVTLGKSEEEIIEVLSKITAEVVGFERKAREYLVEKLHMEIEDKVMRADAVLRAARLLNGNEAINLLGVLRLGVTTRLISQPSLKLINELMILCRPATLQVYYDREMPAPERDAVRSELVRARLAIA
jgi:protein arginine kinase